MVFCWIAFVEACWRAIHYPDLSQKTINPPLQFVLHK